MKTSTDYLKEARRIASAAGLCSFVKRCAACK